MLLAAITSYGYNQPNIAMTIPEDDSSNASHTIDLRMPPLIGLDRYGGTKEQFLTVDTHLHGCTYLGEFDDFSFELTRFVSGESEIILDTQFGAIPLLYSPEKQMTNMVFDPIELLINGIDGLEHTSDDDGLPLTEFKEQLLLLRPFVVEILPIQHEIVIDFAPESDDETDEGNSKTLDFTPGDGTELWQTYRDEETGIVIYSELLEDTIFVQIEYLDEISIEFCLNRGLPDVSRLIAHPTESNARAIHEAIIVDE